MSTTNLSSANSHTLTRWLFLRLLGFVYLFAFASLLPQITALVGQRGILPASNLLESVSSVYGTMGYRLYPTLAWLDSSDTFLQLLCLGGIVLSLLLIVGVLQMPVLALLWLAYLSLVVVGQVFMGYQWDTLLLETGFLAIFLAPIQVVPRLSRESEPSRVILHLMCWLLFRLMFSSGMAKLTSGDDTWLSLAALNYHYETQPLPTPLAWYAHQLPVWFQQLSTLGVFVIEVLVPLLIFMPWRKVRYLAAGAMASLQILIFLTGNYTFFNLLTIALCVLLLDDSVIQRLLPKRFVPDPIHSPAKVPGWKHFLVRVFALAIFIPGAVYVLAFFVPVPVLPEPAVQLVRLIRPFHLVNGYGLFAVMTTSRPEIVVEGSNDGENWLAYEFPYKPGDLVRPPAWIAPYQPRLDWQMWFAALSSAENNPWFASFIQRLSEGSPEVLALLAYNPFPDAPPRYLRAVVYDYHFTDWHERDITREWWKREFIGLYFPSPTRP
jgi:lipase maturation factor 1